MCVGLEVDIGDLHIPIYLQPVNLIEGLHTVDKVKQVLTIHKHLKPLVTTADRHLTKE